MLSAKSNKHDILYIRVYFKCTGLAGLGTGGGEVLGGGGGGFRDKAVKRYNRLIKEPHVFITAN